jgi:Zn-dependent protease with chaperone function
MDARRRRTLTQRAALAVVLWAGFWVLGLALAAALLWVPLAQVRYEGGPGPAGLLAGLGGAMVLWALRPRGWFKKAAPRPSPLDPAALPALQAFVAAAAARSGAPPPDELQLLGRASAYISHERRSLFHRVHVVGLGLPLFAFLSRSQLASVLAHELGHRHGGDLLLGPWVHRTGTALAAAIGDLQDSMFFLDAPFRAYGTLFLGVSGAVSREQELAADAHAAAVHGVQATWEALERVHRLGRCWDVYFAFDAVPFIERGVRLPLLDGFRRFLAQPAYRPEVAEALAAGANERPAPGDSHPPVPERLAALAPGRGQRGGQHPDELEVNCLDLLGGPEAAEDAWFERAVEGPPLARLTWEQVGPERLLPGLLERFTAGPLDPRRAPLARLPELVADAEAVWDALRSPGLNLLSPAAKRRQGERTLGDWLAAALFVRGFAPEVRPGAALRLRRGAEEVVPAEVVEALVRGGGEGEAYRRRCEAWEAPQA